MLIKKIILLICNFIFLLYADEAFGAVVTKTPAYAKSRIEDITGVKIPSDAKMVFHYYSRTSWQENDEQYSVFEFKSEPTEWLMSNSFSDEKNELLKKDLDYRAEKVGVPAQYRVDSLDDYMWLELNGVDMEYIPNKLCLIVYVRIH